MQYTDYIPQYSIQDHHNEVYTNCNQWDATSDFMTYQDDFIELNNEYVIYLTKWID